MSTYPTQGGGGAPDDAEYIVGEDNPNLSNDLVLSNGTGTEVDFSTPGLAKINVTGSSASTVFEVTNHTTNATLEADSTTVHLLTPSIGTTVTLTLPEITADLQDKLFVFIKGAELNYADTGTINTSGGDTIDESGLTTVILYGIGDSIWLQADYNGGSGIWRNVTTRSGSTVGTTTSRGFHNNSGTVTLTSESCTIQTFSPTGDITYELPSSNVEIGKEFLFFKTGTDNSFTVTVATTGGNIFSDLGSSKILGSQQGQLLWIKRFSTSSWLILSEQPIDAEKIPISRSAGTYTLTKDSPMVQYGATTAGEVRFNIPSNATTDVLGKQFCLGKSTSDANPVSIYPASGRIIGLGGVANTPVYMYRQGDFLWIQAPHSTGSTVAWRILGRGENPLFMQGSNITTDTSLAIGSLCNNYLVDVDADPDDALTINLPAASSSMNGYETTIKQISAGTVTYAVTGGGNIDSDTTYTTNTIGDSTTFRILGGVWRKVGNFSVSSVWTGPTTVSGDVTLDDSDTNIILVDASTDPCNITLDLASTNKEFFIMCTLEGASSAITVSGNGDDSYFGYQADPQLLAPYFGHFIHVKAYTEDFGSGDNTVWTILSKSPYPPNIEGNITTATYELDPSAGDTWLLDPATAGGTQAVTLFNPSEPSLSTSQYSFKLISAGTVTFSVAGGGQIDNGSTKTVSGLGTSIILKIISGEWFTFAFDDVNANINIVFDGGGSELTTGVKVDLEVPFNCVITQADLLADQSGSVIIDIWKDTYANFPPDNSDSITASAPPTISAATKSTDSTLTGWTTTLSKGNILRFNIDSVSTITRVTLALSVRKV